MANMRRKHEAMTFAKASARPRRTGITIVAGYCIFAGLSEVWVGITGNWLGLLAKPLKPSFLTALVGSSYVAAGIALLSKRRTGALLGIVFVLLEVLGRVHLVRTGRYPSRGPDLVKSVVGGAIAILVVVYVAAQWRKFDAR
jgi:uncharacterized membrane protein YccC